MGESHPSVALLAAHGVLSHFGDTPMDDPGNVRSLSPEQGKTSERSGSHTHLHAWLWQKWASDGRGSPPCASGEEECGKNSLCAPAPLPTFRLSYFRLSISPFGCTSAVFFPLFCSFVFCQTYFCWYSHLQPSLVLSDKSSNKCAYAGCSWDFGNGEGLFEMKPFIFVRRVLSLLILSRLKKRQRQPIPV